MSFLNSVTEEPLLGPLETLRFRQNLSDSSPQSLSYEMLQRVEERAQQLIQFFNTQQNHVESTVNRWGEELVSITSLEKKKADVEVLERAVEDLQQYRDTIQQVFTQLSGVLEEQKALREIAKRSLEEYQKRLSDISLDSPRTRSLVAQGNWLCKKIVWEQNRS